MDILNKSKSDYIKNNLNDKNEIRIVKYENKIKLIDNILN